jgi:hypothetical protein
MGLDQQLEFDAVTLQFYALCQYVDSATQLVTIQMHCHRQATNSDPVSVFAPLKFNLTRIQLYMEKEEAATVNL